MDNKSKPVSEQATQDLIELIDIGRRAVEVHAANERVKDAKRELSDAYADFKAKKNLDRVERDTKQWKRMIKKTKPEYRALMDAKRIARNAQSRLDRAAHKQSFALRRAADPFIGLSVVA